MFPTDSMFLMNGKNCEKCDGSVFLSLTPWHLVQHHHHQNVHLYRTTIVSNKFSTFRDALVPHWRNIFKLHFQTALKVFQKLNWKYLSTQGVLFIWLTHYATPKIKLITFSPISDEALHVEKSWTVVSLYVMHMLSSRGQYGSFKFVLYFQHRNHYRNNLSNSQTLPAFKTMILMW